MTAQDLGSLSLDECATRFHEENRDFAKSMESTDAWLRYVENATTQVAEFVRRDMHDMTLRALGKAFGLLCCFVEEYRQIKSKEKIRFERPLSQIVWNKYPALCYACCFKYTGQQIIKREHLECICLGAPSATEKEKDLARDNRTFAARNKKNVPKTVDEWGLLIKEIYGGTHKEMSLTAICLHFLEEVGEVAEAKREVEEGKATMEELEEEIADVFSWIFGLINKIDQLLEPARRYYAHLQKLPELRASDIMNEALQHKIE